MLKDPDFEIRGMAEYHVRILLGAVKPFIECDQPGPYESRNLIDVQQSRYRMITQLVEDSLREAYFRGATYGLSLASATKYMIVTAEQMEAIKERIGEESDA
jgi:hypothetical protein